jgi:hypothetical protein
MLRVSTRGFTFDDEKGGCDPTGDLKCLLSLACASCSNFENAIANPAAASLHDLSSLCRDVQSVNVSLLKRALMDEGETPEATPGFWNSLVGLVSVTAAFIGDEALLASFRTSELHLFDQYETKIASFEGDLLNLIQHQLIPNQLRICELLGATRGGADEQMATAVIPTNFDLA